MNSKIRNPNVERMTKRAAAHSSFVLRHSFVIRASSFVIVAVAFAMLAGLPLNAPACASCYGASDSPLAQGMNWGIVTLLGFVGLVLGGISLFFVHIGRRSARLNAAGQSQNPTDQQP